MRRSFLVTATVAACVLTLTACGDESADAADTPTNAAVVSSAAESSTTPATSAPVIPTPAPTSSRLPTMVVPSQADTSNKRRPPTAGTHRGGPPAARQAPGSPVSGDGYVRPGTTADFQFSAGSGKWQCVVEAEVAGCFGDVPKPADGTRLPAQSDSVRVTARAGASFESGGAAAFGSRNAKNRPTVGKNLPAGRSITNGVFVCSALPDDGVQCETVSAGHGFRMHPNRSWLW